MEAERLYTKQPSRTIQQKRGGEGALEMVDNRPAGILQAMSDNKFIIQKQTKIVNSETDYFYDDVFYNKNELVGTRVDILLDPSDPKKGSEPGTDLNNTMYAINEHWKTSWIKGHLINHHLGGPGVAANLYPISRSANLYHCNYVENAVLNALGSLNSGEGILYSVEVTEAAHTVSNPKCKFTCEAYKTDKNNISGKYEPIFKGIDVISEPDSKPRPTFSGGFDMWGASWNISPSDQLSSQKRLFSGWRYVGNGQNSWNNGFLNMEAERLYTKQPSRTIQQKRGGEGALEMVDNRPAGILQAMSEHPIQRVEDDENTLQGKFAQPIQRMEDDEDTMQGKFEAPIQKKNLTGMPDNLKAGIEDLSGFSMDDVRVHYGSSKPAAVQAHAYTQGTDIHIAPGQERHLPHEAWHVAQQMAGRVEPTTEIGGMPVNDNAALEHEADVMGARANSY